MCAIKISDHHVRSPMLNVARACQTCHHLDEAEIQARVLVIQDRTAKLLDRAEEAVLALVRGIEAAKAAGATDDELKLARDHHRKSQWRLDFISAENSMGFHAPQESARILAEAVDYARQGEVAAQKVFYAHAPGGAPAPAAPAVPAKPAAPSPAKAAPPAVPAAPAAP